ncbi:MAG: pyridoxamine 5'-phosphate oxidase family protein [Clostridia bacterium]|nr:pyridoxamine 5'-phosphate oxidase family protein [Clostridia bacterium]
MFRELIRKHKQLPEETCIEVLKNETRGVLSVLGDDGYPYGTPMNYWYNEENGRIYFHCGKVGHRLDALRRCDKVSFCVYDKGYIPEGEWAYKVNSVIVFGRMHIIDHQEQIIDIVTKLSHKFTQDDDYIRDEIDKGIAATLLLELIPEHMCGKVVTES